MCLRGVLTLPYHASGPLAKNRMTFATSCAVQDGVFRLLCVAMASIMSGSSAAGSVPVVIGVMTFPGQITLQRIPAC